MLNVSAKEAMPGQGVLPDLGPFEPPPVDEVIDPELHGPPPREVSHDLYANGRIYRRGRVVAWIFLYSGASAFVLSLLPITQTWALYFLPLAWLDWIGYALVAIGGLGLMRLLMPPRESVYIREGIPLICRVVAIAKIPTQFLNGQASRYAARAVVDLRDPQTNECVRMMTHSSEYLSLKDRAITYHVGDYATAVYLPSKGLDSLRLYHFLGLKPDVGVVDRRRSRSVVIELLRTGALSGTIAGFLLLLGWNLYAFGLYRPLSVDSRVAAGGSIGFALVIALPAFVAWIFSERRNLSKTTALNQEADARGEAIEIPGDTFCFRPGVGAGLLKIGVVIGVLLLTGMTGYCWMLTANAWFDRSTERRVPAEILEMTMTTHSFIIREYSIKARIRPGGEINRSSNPAHMNTLFLPDGTYSPAVARVREGWLGWPWVEGIDSAP